MKEQIKKLSENQNKIVSKISAMDLLLAGLVETNNALVKENETLRNRIGGIETILVESGITKEAIKLHQSFDDKKMRENNKGEQEKMI
jgi:regulator of replication initiation timing